MSDTLNTGQSLSSRTQHVVPASLVLLLAIGVVWLSFTREPAAAFLFPRLIGSFMLGLAIWNFARAVTGRARIGDGLSYSVVRNVAPGLLVMTLLVLVAAKALGFYTGSAMAFFVIHTLYDPASPRHARVWVKRMLLTALFMAIIYALFTLILKVQVPRGSFL